MINARRLFMVGPCLAALTALSNVNAAPEGVAQSSLETGIEAYVGGDLTKSVTTLTKALQEGLPGRQMARAHFYRGLACRKLQKPGQAISDLTTALQQPEDLTPAERADAEFNRMSARREAGIADSESIVTDASWATRPGAVSSRPIAWAIGKTEPKVDLATSTGMLPQRRYPPVSSSWQSVTNAHAISSLPAAAVVLSRDVTPLEATTSTPGKFQVQIGIAESHSEAASLAVRLTSQHGSKFGGRRVAVAKTEVVSIGTVYRLTVGPYVSADEPQELCLTLRDSGYDCLIVPS
jgi:SPOR domain